MYMYIHILQKYFKYENAKLQFERTSFSRTLVTFFMILNDSKIIKIKSSNLEIQ